MAQDYRIELSGIECSLDSIFLLGLWALGYKTFFWISLAAILIGMVLRFSRWKRDDMKNKKIW